MAPPPPVLNDDAIAEILLRLPPDEPACLFRAAVVCKPWRHIISDPAFSRRYRECHRTPPLLGFLHNTTYRYGHGPVPRFVPTTAAARPFPHINSAIHGNPWWIADCRHGRVLVRPHRENVFIVWDPITGHREELHRPDIPNLTYTAVVLCAVAGCDHRDCHGGPFQVIFLYTVKRHSTVHACVYSSAAHAWGMPVAASTGSSVVYGLSGKRGALIKDVYYCNLRFGERIVKYQLGGHSLSMVDPPHVYDTSSLLLPNEDGSLGLAGITISNRLHLWSMMENPQGVAGWIQSRVIELDKLCDIRHRYHVDVGGFAEGVGFIYMTTSDEVFTLDLKSERVWKLSEPGESFHSIFPFISFYTPGMVPSFQPIYLAVHDLMSCSVKL